MRLPMKRNLSPLPTYLPLRDTNEPATFRRRLALIPGWWRCCRVRCTNQGESRRFF